MEKNPEIELRGCYIAAELAAGGVGQAFGRFQFHNDTPLNQHVDAMEADLLTTEHYGDRKLAVDMKPSISQRDIECACINRLNEPVSELVVDVEERAHDRMTELLLDDARRSIRVIRVHSGNSAVPLLGSATELFHA